MTWRDRALRVVVGAALVLLLWPLRDLRQGAINAIVGNDAPPGRAAALPAATGAGLPPTARTRVVLIDGAGRDTAAGMAAWNAVCARGLDLTVDVGFPTVSLPVQSVLWTGLTQQQSGLQYHIGKLAAPPRGATPPQVDSVAVAESHPEIVHSFGFTRVEPADAPVPDEWREVGFPAAALAAVASDATLAFVHVLRIDEAGHASGAASHAYADAAAWSDDLLARLWAARPADAQTLWIVLSDHGHRAAGGHGGAEPEIRLVRACVAGGPVRPGDRRMIHLVDLARALVDALGVHPHPHAIGRPWQAALADPVRGATLPRPGPARWLLAALLALAGLLSLRTGPRRHARWDRSLRWLGPPLLGPLWLGPALGLGWVVLGVLGVALYSGWPTLSNPAVYAPLGRDLLYGSSPGLIALVVLGALAMRRFGCGGPAVVRAVLLPGAAWIAAVLVLCREPEALLFGPPPLMPWSTGLASVLLVQGRAACLVLALLLAVRIATRWLTARRQSLAARAPSQPTAPPMTPSAPADPA